MGFILLLLLISISIMIITYYSTSETPYKKENAIWSIITCGIISTVIIITPLLGVSYFTYLEMEENIKTLEQYGTTINLYAQKGVKEFKSNHANEITDLKYQKYQEQLGKMIVDLRNQIIRYNKELTSKTIMNESWFWNWVIIMPDSDKILKMQDYVD